MPTSPIHELHAHLGARFTDFGGWEMPVQYDGVLAEHATVRKSVGVFDVSHLGRFSLRGPGATELLRSELCNDIAHAEAGRAQYTMALTPDGGVVDDIIVLRFTADEYWVLPNGVNYDSIMERFSGHSEVEVGPKREDTAFFAVQGPEAPDLVKSVLGTGVGRFRVKHSAWGSTSVVLAGTGYTGERGAELAVPAHAAADLFRAIVGAGATPCGLGARDTLRLEMGYPLWGQDLDVDTTPLEAGLSWVVDWDHGFVGREALALQRRHGIPRQLVAFRTGGRRVARSGYRLRAGRSTGSVTSGNFSPVLEMAIGMGYLAPPPRDEDELEVEIRGEWHTVTRQSLPFVEAGR